MSDAAAMDHAQIGELFQIDGNAAAGGGVVDDPWPVWAEILSRGGVHKGTLAECMGLSPEVSGCPTLSISWLALATSVASRDTPMLRQVPTAMVMTAAAAIAARASVCSCERGAADARSRLAS